MHSFNELVRFTSLPYNPNDLFYNGIKLKDVTLPPQITYLRSNSFSQSGNVYAYGTHLVFKTLVLTASSVVKRDTNAVRYSNRSSWQNYPNLVIYVPDELVEDYKASSYWSGYVSRIKPMSEYVK